MLNVGDPLDHHSGAGSISQAPRALEQYGQGNDGGSALSSGQVVRSVEESIVGFKPFRPHTIQVNVLTTALMSDCGAITKP